MIVKKSLSSLTRDERYKKNVQGLQATIVTLKRCSVFLEALQPIPGPFSERVEAIKKIFSDKHIEKLRNTDIYAALPVKMLAFYDHLLKSRFSQEMNEVLSFIYELDVNIAVSDVARSKDSPTPTHYHREKIC